MSRKISAEEKITAVRIYLDGKSSQRQLAKMYGVAQSSIQQWISNYEAMGTAAFLTKGLYISIEDKRGETPKKAEFCFEGGLISFVEYLNKSKEKLHETPIYIEKKGEFPLEIALQYTSAYSENIYSFVNNINTVEGGTHLEGFRRSLTKVFNDYAKNHNLLKEKDGNLQGEDIREGVTAVISVKVKEPQFEGQTKTKLGNAEVRKIASNIISTALDKFLLENPDTATIILSFSFIRLFSTILFFTISKILSFILFHSFSMVNICKSSILT